MPAMETKQVELRSYGSTDLLVCPRCGFDHMHHGEVERWDRDEDAKSSRYTRAASDATEVKAVSEGESANPSDRRGGLIISFECEGCGGGAAGDRIELCIAQHKGQTEMEWRFHPKTTPS